jgi:hypothetical protein
MSQLEAGLTDDQLFPKVPGNIQKHQYSDPSSAFCQRFAVLRAVFNTKLGLLFARHRVKLGGQPDVFRVSLWCNEETGGVYPFSIDSSASAQVPAQEPKVWLGLSHVVRFPDLCVRIPRAIETKVHRPDELRTLGEVDCGEDRNSGSNPPARTPADDFPKLMDTLKTGSNIASATIHCCRLMQNGEEHYDTAGLGPSDVVDSRQEALFQFGFRRPVFAR